MAALKAAVAAAAPSADDGGALQESAADRASLLAGFRCSPKHLPCSYLYDTRGSDLYEDITALEEYYPFQAEQALLTSHAQDIISHIPSGADFQAFSGCHMLGANVWQLTPCELAVPRDLAFYQLDFPPLRMRNAAAGALCTLRFTAGWRRYRAACSRGSLRWP